MSDQNWLYHLTTRHVALLIKTKGMTSALTRIGVAVANPNGAFAKDRKTKEPAMAQSELKVYLADLLARGSTLDKIKQAEGQYVPFTFVVQGSNDADIPRLDQIKEQRIDAYRKALIKPNGGRSDWRRAKTFREDPLTGQAAAQMILIQKNHSLVRLAVQYASWRMNIEEAITASHVYFLKPQDAESGYRDYKQKLGDTPIVVLRVKKDDVRDLKQDDSEGRAMMTKQTVQPDVLQVMENHETAQQRAGFVNLDYRCNNDNWTALAQLQ